MSKPSIHITTPKKQKVSSCDFLYHISPKSQWGASAACPPCQPQDSFFISLALTLRLRRAAVAVLQAVNRKKDRQAM